MPIRNCYYTLGDAMRFGFLGRIFGDRAARGATSDFEASVQQVLARNSLGAARQVGGVFTLDDAAVSSIRAGFPGFPAFAEATTILVEHGNNRASAFVVGRTADGQEAIASLQNYARPDAINSTTDSIQARRNAHLMRTALNGVGTEIKPERGALLSPAVLAASAPAAGGPAQGRGMGA